MGEGFWPSKKPDSFNPPQDRKDQDWDWQRMRDLEDEYHEDLEVLLPARIDHPLPEVLTRIENYVVPQSSDKIGDLSRMPYRQYLTTEHWQRMRAAALERGHNECAVCAARKDLEVHHRSYERRGCELAEDLIVLCRKCHALFHQHRRMPPMH